MKTRREVLVDAGVPEAELALVDDPDLDEPASEANKDYPDLALALSFSHRHTEQGEEYWEQWARHLFDSRQPHPGPSGKAAAEESAASLRERLDAAEVYPWGRDGMMAMCAFRYCLGRRTYVVSECAEWLTAIWGDLPDGARNLIHAELREAFKEDGEARNTGRAYRIGSDCDREEWSRLLSFIEGQEKCQSNSS